MAYIINDKVEYSDVLELEIEPIPLASSWEPIRKELSMTTTLYSMEVEFEVMIENKVTEYFGCLEEAVQCYNRERH